MAPDGWRCATCGATNPFGNRRCRLCQTLVPPGLLPDSLSDDAAQAQPLLATTAPAYVPYVPYEPPPPPVSPLPPPGGWLAPDPTAPSLPPPPLPPTGYGPPPPGWYPGVPATRRRRRGWVITLCIAAPVVLIGVIVFGIGFARGTDPEAAKDRDSAERGLLVNADLGGTFSEIAHRSFARSRGGIRVEDDVAECGAADAAFENRGRAVVDSVLQSRAGASIQVLSQEIMVVDSPSNAGPVFDAVAGTARTCVDAALRKAAGVPISVNLSVKDAPSLGDRASEFSGVAGGSSVAVPINLLVVQQGRAIVLLMAFDTTGSFSGPRLESAMLASLSRLAPIFGN